MNLRAIKKEVKELPEIDYHLKEFKNAWVKVIKNNTNNHMPFLKNLPKEQINVINKDVKFITKAIQRAKDSLNISERLLSHIHNLIQLKVSTLSGNKHKSKNLSNKLLNDDLLSISATKEELLNFEQDLSLINKMYSKTNQHICEYLSLDEQIIFETNAHRFHLSTVSKITAKHKGILKNLIKETKKVIKKSKK